MQAGRCAEAAADLEWIRSRFEVGGMVETGFLPVDPELAECYVRLGQPARAAEVVERLAAAASRTGRASIQAAAARCRGMLADDDAFDAEFHCALARHEVAASPLQRARTLLQYGLRLRRAKRRRDARQQLDAAAALLEEAGADGWLRECRAEINASGRRAMPTQDPTGDQLTPQEWQIALTAAEGLTNREIATRVFLSPKTVDYHLGNVYRKLGLRSRHELIRRLATGTADQ
jgi:DNA-binding NarL/FixJ family response regulator